MAKIKILDMREIPSGDPKRIGKMDRVISYQVDGITTDIIVLPAETFTEEILKTQIKLKSAEKAKWVGKEFEV